MDYWQWGWEAAILSTLSRSNLLTGNNLVNDIIISPILLMIISILLMIMCIPLGGRTPPRTVHSYQVAQGGRLRWERTLPSPRMKPAKLNDVNDVDGDVSDDGD